MKKWQTGEVKKPADKNELCTLTRFCSRLMHKAI